MDEEEEDDEGLYHDVGDNDMTEKAELDVVAAVELVPRRTSLVKSKF